MKKVQVRVWWPVQMEDSEEIEIEVPDNVDVQDYLFDNAPDIVEKTSGECFDVKVFDLKIAGVRLIE